MEKQIIIKYQKNDATYKGNKIVKKYLDMKFKN